jgi:PAS domain-containing protein
VESSSDGISSLTLEGTVNSWNKGAERIYGYSAAEILGRPSFPSSFRLTRAVSFGKVVGTGFRPGRVVEPFETVRYTKGWAPDRRFSGSLANQR